MRAFALALLLTPPLTFARLAAQAGTVPPGVTTPLADVLPALSEHSAWVQSVRYEGEQPDKSRRGVYPVGNGRTFGYMGLGARANTMQGVSGPSYQTAEVFAPKGHFGEHTLDLTVAGKAVDLPEQHVRRVRGANFVVTADEDPRGLSLRTLTFAPPDGTSLVRVIEVANHGDKEQAGVALALRLDPSATAPSADVRRIVYERDGRRCQALFTLFGNTPTGVALPSLPPKGTWRGVLGIRTQTDTTATAPEFATAQAQLDAAIKSATATLEWWQQRLEHTAYFDTDHRKLRDLFHDWKVLMLVQRDAGSGAVSPMVNYRGCWVRDSTGPLLAFLRFNMWQEAKDILVYLYNATRLLGHVPNHVPLDLDVSKLGDKQIDWDKVEVGASEVPSWIVLMHFWYWRVTRDHDLIRAHKPLLDRCLRGQRRVDEVLLPFHGDETWLHGAFYSLWPERVRDGRFVAEDRWQGRETFSFAAAVQYLLCIQAIGEMETGLDEAAHPDKYAGDAAKDVSIRPGQRYLTRSFSFMQALEKAFWVEDLSMFAPALSPVNRQPHREPYADVNLMPLWLGWTFPTGEKSRDNLRTSLAKLWLRDGRVGQTPTTGYACGHTQGKLVTALTERDAKNRLDSVDALLAMAEPAGEWGEVYDDTGRPVAAYDKQWPNRCRPWESGINLDSLLFAICGVRFVAVPNFDARDIRGKLRLPHGATYVSMRNVRKDGRDLNIYWRETFEKMTEKERKENEEKVPEKRRDPEATHRRLRFRVDLNSPDPKQGYYDVGLNAACTLFVRYLTQKTPVDEVEYWADDNFEILPAAATTAGPLRHAIGVPAGAKVLYLSNRGLARELAGGEPAVCLVDTGLPFSPADLAAALLPADGKSPIETLFVDWRAQAEGRSTFKAAGFWSAPVWLEAVEKFKAAGGRVVRAEFIGSLAVDGHAKVTADADGRIELPDDKEVVATATIESDAAREAVLRVGSNTDVMVEVNAQGMIEHNGNRHPLPDLDAALIRLVAGPNHLRFVLRGDGKKVLYARVTDARGLPADGVR